MTDVLIIGAGLSGLVAANILKDAHKSVTVLDKGRSVGGRLATRRIQNGIADHGAQFFTVRTDIFQQQVDQWLANDIAYIWGHGWSDGSLKRTTADGHPRYVAREGMNALARDLAKGLKDVRVNVRAVGVSHHPEGFWVTDEDGNSYTAKTLLMTPPVPQSLDLLTDVPLAKDDRDELERIAYGPCLCGLFVIDGDINLPEPGALQNFENTVYWLADNKAKGISPNEQIITVHVEHNYSQKHYDDPDADNLAFIQAALEPHLTEGTIIKEAQLKKWKYSIPISTYPHDILQAEDLPLVFAGDAFGGRGRIEGAYLSGRAAGKALLELLG